MFPALKSINVLGCNICDGDLQATASTRPQIEELSFGKDPYVDSPGGPLVRDKVNNIMTSSPREAVAYQILPNEVCHRRVKLLLFFQNIPANSAQCLDLSETRLLIDILHTVAGNLSKRVG